MTIMLLGGYGHMKQLTIPDSEIVILALQDEIRRSSEARYDHRLHGVLLVAQGMSSRQVAEILGDAPRTVEYWIHRFLDEGLAGLADADRPGRPRKLTQNQIEQINQVLRSSPSDVGLTGNLWDGKTLNAFISKSFGVELGVRQCQRLFRQLGFRLRKPRPQIARANPELQEEFKKNETMGRGDRS